MSGAIHKGKNPCITAVNIQHSHKNTITLIKAFERIRNIIPHDLYLIGRITPGTAWLADYVREHGLDNRILFKGFLDDAALAAMIKGSALYVNPSLFEGFGMTTVEAMLAGVPALASCVTAVPEVTMGLCSYYEPPEDEKTLAEAMKKILLEEKYHDADKLKIISGKIYDQYNYVKISRRYFDLMTSLMTGED
jgi:glycosyltransferase involved in cell wall biosynthesis